MVVSCALLIRISPGIAIMRTTRASTVLLAAVSMVEVLGKPVLVETVVLAVDNGATVVVDGAETVTILVEVGCCSVASKRDIRFDST